MLFHEAYVESYLNFLLNVSCYDVTLSIQSMKKNDGTRYRIK